MQWRKDPGMRYTQLCMYIDGQVPKIATKTADPGVDDTVYNYLFLVLKALAIKKRMFQKFEDYDGYAFYGATRLYFALIKNYQNQGKKIKGKVIRPIKSCLNYMKALMYPMKLEYQKETFNEVVSADFVSKKFDAFTYQELLKNDAYASQLESTFTTQYLEDAMRAAPELLKEVLAKSPFKKDSLDYKYLYISLLLNCNNMLHNKKSLSKDLTSVILWKLPKSMASYVKVLFTEFCTKLKLEILDCYNERQVDDVLLNDIISNPGGVEGTNEEQT